MGCLRKIRDTVRHPNRPERMFTYLLLAIIVSKQWTLNSTESTVAFLQGKN